jgi:hypothetical protein
MYRPDGAGTRNTGAGIHFDVHRIAERSIGEDGEHRDIAASVTICHPDGR